MLFCHSISTTWPRILKTHDSAFLGKWHLGGHGVPDLMPAAHGFEELAFFDAGGSPYFEWRSHWDRTKPHFPTMPGNFRIGKAGEPSGQDYLTNDEKSRAVRYLESRKGNNKPFLLYYAPFAVHTPFEAPKPDVKRFATKKQSGHFGRTNATYASMLKHLDDSIGAIRTTLESTGLAENTVIDCTDFLPTVADLTGNTPPAGLDGQSMLPLLKDPSSPGPERTIIWHYPFNVQVIHPDNGSQLSPHSGIRVGPHKLIWDWHGKLELYHIADDPFEKIDLADKNPEITHKLHQQLKSWLTDNVAPRYFPQRDESVSPEAADKPFPFRDLR